MENLKNLAIASCFLGLAGCSAMSVPVSDQMNDDPSERSAAIQGIAVTEVVPAGATVLGEIEAEYCHLNWYDPLPQEVALKVDLQLSAFSSGADGIADVEFDDEGVSSPGQNCWKIYTAKATAYITEEMGP